MKVYRAALIGCGKIGSEFSLDPRVRGIYTHAGAYNASPRTELVGVCDPDARRLAACGEKWNVMARFSSAREMLDRLQPDIVSICSPDASHAEMIGLALKSGARALIVEKPIALDAGIAMRLIADARRLGAIVIVNYTRRYAAGHVRVREMIERGQLGDVQAVTGYYTKGVKHNGTHWFDLARFLIGEATEVEAVDVVADGTEDPTLDVAMRFTGGARASVVGCSSAFSIFEMDIVGTRGRIRVVDSGHTIELYGVADSPHYSGYRSLELLGKWPGGMDDAMARMVENCIDCLDGESAPVCSGDDGIAALEIAQAACASLDARRRILLK